ncbi:MAG: hypothetical protein KDB21_02510 [Acidimicrobiales bacterium]|nr:hypothetical protein [Acidimicrobiales bacterium]
MATLGRLDALHNNAGLSGFSPGGRLAEETFGVRVNAVCPGGSRPLQNFRQTFTDDEPWEIWATLGGHIAAGTTHDPDRLATEYRRLHDTPHPGPPS